MADVKIVMTDHGRGEVFIDGAEVPNVQAIAFEGSAVSSRPNRLALTLLSETVSIEGPANVVRPRLPWWKRLLGFTDLGHVPPARNPTPIRLREGSTRTNIKPVGAVRPPPPPAPPPSRNVRQW